MCPPPNQSLWWAEVGRRYWQCHQGLTELDIRQEPENGQKNYRVIKQKSTGTSISSAILTISSSTLKMGIVEMLNITQSPLSYVSSHPSMFWHILSTAGSPSSAWGMPSWDFFLQEAFSDFQWKVIIPSLGAPLSLARALIVALPTPQSNIFLTCLFPNRL